jgi:hypothetical protein
MSGGVTVTDEQYASLKKTNPTLAAKMTYVPAKTTAPVASATPTKTTTPTNTTIKVAGTDGSVTLTPEQQAKVVQNNPTLASKVGISSAGLPSLASVKEDTRTLPTSSSITPAPLPSKPKSNLVEFSDMLSRATDMARSRRLETQQGVLQGAGYVPGQVTPQTMAGIVQLLERSASNYAGGVTDAAVQAARDQFTADQNAYDTAVKAQEQEKINIQNLALKMVENGLSKEVIAGITSAPTLDAAIAVAAGAVQSKNPDLKVESINGSIVTYNTKTGQVVSQVPVGEDKLSGTSSIQEYNFAVKNGYTGTYIQYQNEDANRKQKAITPAVAPTEKTVSSGNLVITQADVGEGSAILESSRGSDGYVNSGTYVQMYQKWVNAGGMLADFLKTYPPENYVNPNDTSVPVALRPKAKAGTETPFG